MANRYWVGGAGTWNNTNTANWSTSSGGSGGASPPTVNDNVVIDDQSGVLGSVFSISVTSNVACANFRYERTATGSFTGINGDFTMTVQNSVTWLGEGGSTTLLIAFGGNYTNTMTVNNFGAFKLKCTGTAFSSQTISGANNSFELEIVNTNVVISMTSPTLRSLRFTGTTNQNLTLSQETTLAGDLEISANCTITGNTLNLAPSTGLVNLNINGTISSLKLSGTISNQIYAFKGNGSITTLSENSTVAFVLQFDTTSDIKFSTWSVSGSAGAIVSVRSNVSGVRASIRKNGGGVVSTNYMNVKDMQPYPDNTWISYNSTNAGNNWQWYFDNFTKPTSSLFFGNHA